jgi:hypothetical protein
MIDITGVDLVKFVQAVYDLSKPQGLGFMHFRTGPLSDQDAKKCLPPDGRIAVDTDYVNGRACKLGAKPSMEKKKLLSEMFGTIILMLNSLIYSIASD